VYTWVYVGRLGGVGVRGMCGLYPVESLIAEIRGCTRGCTWVCLGGCGGGLGTPSHNIGVYIYPKAETNVVT